MLRRSRFVADSKWLAPVFFVSLVISACGSDDKLAVVPQNTDAPTQLAPAKAAPIDAAITDTTQGQQTTVGTALPEPVPTISEPTELVTEGNVTDKATSTTDTVSVEPDNSSNQDLVLSESSADDSGNSTVGGIGTFAPSENPETQDGIIELDTDGDGINNVDDPDDDNDGFNDEYDKFPLDGSEFLDWDADGIGDFADQDDDNDRVPDTADFLPLNPDCSSELEIFQGECIYGFSDKAEILEFDHPYQDRHPYQERQLWGIIAPKA